ncbi:MAG: hypothetical protein OEU46_21000, partial [Alphaproteobacteria bacterium]|nr:hypothetical protein [Alphaproteobacteria bacterium]
MLRLRDFSLEEPSETAALRRKCAERPNDVSGQIAFGVALSRSGCTYEASAILRPLRAQWKSSDDEQPARIALETQTWWNKNWRAFAQFKHAGNKEAALQLLGDRAVLCWDLPPLLVHLGDFAAGDGQFDLANHLYQRVAYLSQRGLPKMNMAPFAYVAQASLVETLLLSGKPGEALERHRAITPNAGNAMAHEIQHLKLLVATQNFDEAMRQAASTIMTAKKHRSGYSKVVRMEFIETAPELAPLRDRSDWTGMLNDPSSYLKL